ncbi:MAG: right-handed parallel beta-helix repeat-containing protein [Hyphomicrobiaceae bacterium]|nr:MAG: right-handed parallel beta-helix repeat-containing protein [Hyphomicrobiaceae bacterium]
MRRRAALAAFLAALLTAEAGQAATYYVDFEAGSDAASGTSTSEPWQHAPGDDNATANARLARLEPGDRVLFKGGVRYRGSIRVNASGTSERPIVFSGGMWGEAPAIIDGTEIENGAWRPCRSTADCKGHPRWAEIVTRDLDADVESMQSVFAGGRMLFLAQHPPLKDRFWHDDLWSFIDLGPAWLGLATRSSIRDERLAGEAADAYDGALVALWVEPNRVVMSPVRAYEPAQGTLHFAEIANPLPEKRGVRYAIMNRVAAIARPLDYAIDPATRRLFAMLPPELRSAQVSISQRRFAFDLTGRSHIVIEGFHVEGFAGRPDSAVEAVVNIGAGAKQIVVRDCSFESNALVRNVEAVIRIDGADGIRVERNRLRNNPKSSGIVAGRSRDIAILGNLVERAGLNGIRLIAVENALVANNRVHELRGVHGNGMSFYLENRNVAVIGNRVSAAHPAMTMHGGRDGKLPRLDLLFYANTFEGPSFSWGTLNGIHILSNVFRNDGQAKAALNLEPSDRAIILSDNVIEGLVMTNPAPPGFRLFSNTYAALSWSRSAKFGWKLEPGSRVLQGPLEVVSRKPRPALDLSLPDLAVFAPLLREPMPPLPRLPVMHVPGPKRVGANQ